MPSGTNAKPSPASAALTICGALLRTSWPSTCTFSLRLPFSNSHAYSPLWLGRGRLTHVRPVLSCAVLGTYTFAKHDRAPNRASPEPAESVTQRGPRHAELCRRSGKASVSRYGDEGQQVAQVLALHC